MSAVWVILAILRKDLEDAVRSHTLLPMLLGPILLSLFFARTLSDSDLKRPVVAVHDPGSSGLVRLLAGSDLLVIQTVGSQGEGRELVARGRVPAALAVPLGFDRALAEGRFPRLDLTTDESRRGQVEMVRQSLRLALREQAGQETPADARTEKISEDRSGPRQVLLPLWVTFAVLSGLLVASASMVEEKDTGTLEQMLCAPVGMSEVLAGKVSASWLLGFGTAVLVLALNEGWPGLRGAGILVLALGSLAFAGLGALIGLWAPSQATGSTVAGLAFLVLFLPGALAEVSLAMDRAAVWSPGYYFQDGVSRALLGGAGFADLGQHLAVLAGTVLGVFVVGIWRLRQD